MISGIFLYGIFLFLCLIGLFIWLVIIVFKEPTEIENAPIVWNFSTKYTDGRATGVENNIIKSPTNRYVSEILPKDINVRKTKHIEPIKLIIGERKIISLPKGTLSKDRDINIYLPNNSEELPDNLKETEFGKLLMGYIELKNAINTEVKAVREGSNRKDEIIKRLGDGEVSIEFINTIQELAKDIAKTAAKEELGIKKQISSFRPITEHSSE